MKIKIKNKKMLIKFIYWNNKKVNNYILKK